MVIELVSRGDEFGRWAATNGRDVVDEGELGEPQGRLPPAPA